MAPDLNAAVGALAQVEKEREAGANVADEAAGAVEDLEAEIAAVRLAASKQVADARREANAAAESAAASRYHC